MACTIVFEPLVTQLNMHGFANAYYRFNCNFQRCYFVFGGSLMEASKMI